MCVALLLRNPEKRIVSLQIKEKCSKIKSTLNILHTTIGNYSNLLSLELIDFILFVYLGDWNISTNDMSTMRQQIDIAQLLLEATQLLGKLTKG